MTPEQDPAGDARSSGVPRRHVIGAAGAASVGALALSACGGSGGTPAGPQAPTAPVDVAATSEVPVGGGITVDKDGVQAVVGQPERGTFTAFSPVCPHQGCTVNPANERYVCPCHGSTFDMATGDVQAGPATTGLTRYPLTVSGERIIIG